MNDFTLPVLVSPPAPPDEATRADLARELRRLITGEVRFSRHDRMLYATDASLYQVEPIGVVMPRSIDEIDTIMRFAAENKLSVLPRGGGTSLAGQCTNESLVIDVSAWCRRIVHIDRVHRTARVEPGVVLDQLNRELAGHGLFFGPDVATSSHATLGGMIGNNSAGARSIVYGRTVEHLLGMSVCLADGTVLPFHRGAAAENARVAELTAHVARVVIAVAGEIRARYPTITRRVNGYNLDLLLDQIERSTPGSFDQVNLAHLVCGSEGTLAFMREATLNLVERPQSVGLAMVTFTGLDEALAALETILETKPSAVELLDDMVINLARENTECRRYVDMLPRPTSGEIGAVLYVEYSAESDHDRNASFARLRDRLPEAPLAVYTEPEAMQQAWKLRKSGEPLLHGLPGRRKPLTFIEDTAVAPERLPDFVREFRAIVEGHETRAAFYAHASVGCLHIRPLIDIHDHADRDRMQRIAEEVTDLVQRYGGALSGEHGDGRVRSPLLERFYGPVLCEAFRSIKAIFDPEHRLNPGNIVSPAPMTSHLRVMPNEQDAIVPELDTYFRYDREHGFASAVEMCNGAGVCRRLQQGTMCPSYRATMDERHATRGRGNALRLAITGQLPGDHSASNPAVRFFDEETLKTLDLCLSCKACKSECPSNVDVAKLKSEYLAQGYRAGRRIPFRDRLFSRVRTLNRLGSALAPLSNALGRLGIVRALTARTLGFDPRRSMPRVDKSLYRFLRARREGSATPSTRPAVILLPDCFSVWSEPPIGRAAVHVLEQFGYRVVIPSLGCCGRPSISLGMLAQAVQICSRTARDLHAAVHREKAVAVLALEPSCLSAITDDWADLKLEGIGRDDVRKLAEHAYLVEDFIDTYWSDHPIRPEFHPPDGTTIVFHGHCHQKALWGVDSSARLLRRIAGDDLTVLDSGCCGMAGAFGMMTDHFDLSMQIGELSVFPPLRAAPQSMILMTGTSCRHQVLDALGRVSRHPIEFVCERIVGTPKSMAR